MFLIYSILILIEHIRVIDYSDFFILSECGGKVVCVSTALVCVFFCSLYIYLFVLVKTFDLI